MGGSRLDSAVVIGVKVGDGIDSGVVGSGLASAVIMGVKVGDGIDSEVVESGLASAIFMGVNAGDNVDIDGGVVETGLSTWECSVTRWCCKVAEER
jgi:hypothetical protein